MSYGTNENGSLKSSIQKAVDLCYRDKIYYAVAIEADFEKVNILLKDIGEEMGIFGLLKFSNHKIAAIQECIQAFESMSEGDYGWLDTYYKYNYC